MQQQRYRFLVILSALVLIFGCQQQNIDFIEVFKDIHANIYRAFEFSVDEDIYNCLAYSFDGEELELRYFEFLKDIRDLEEKGYKNIIQSINYAEISLRRSSKEEAVIYAAWEVSGTVTHKTHEHDRLSIYEAIYTLEPVGKTKTWKIAATTILHSERITSPNRYYDEVDWE